MRQHERGDSLIEVVVAVAIVAIALGAVMAATISATHRFGPDPQMAALQRQAGREMRLATDIMKYQGSSIAPATVATTVPLTGASPIPAHLSISVSPAPQSGFAITITATSDRDPSETATVQSTIPQPVPLPLSTVRSGVLVPAPIGAQ